MPGKTNLTVVTDDEAGQTPASLEEATESSERELLAAMRRRVAAEIDAGVPAHALAPLMRQLRDIDKDIRALDARTEQEAAGHAGAVPDEAFDPTAI
jgi:hypothetical protein